MQGVEAGSARGGSLLSLDAGATRISAVKRHEDRDSLVVRLWNPDAIEDEQRLRFGTAIHGAWTTNLLEERETELSSGGASGRHLDLRLGPHEILTIEIEFESATGASES